MYLDREQPRTIKTDYRIESFTIIIFTPDNTTRVKKKNCLISEITLIKTIRHSKVPEGLGLKCQHC